MFKFTRKDKRTKLEKEIDRVIEEMSYLTPGSAEYTSMASNLKRLKEATGFDKSKSVSPDTIAVVGGNLLGIGLIMNYERLHIMTTKALGFVLRGRV